MAILDLLLDMEREQPRIVNYARSHPDGLPHPQDLQLTTTLKSLSQTYSQKYSWIFSIFWGNLFHSMFATCTDRANNLHRKISI